MKKHILTIFLTIATVSSFAEPFKGGSFQLSPAVGAIPGIGLNIRGDYGLTDTWGPGILTVGVYAGYRSDERKNTVPLSGVSSKNNYVASLARATYKYYLTYDLSVYGGVMTGPVFRTVKTDTDAAPTVEASISETFFHIGPTLGADFSFARNIGIFAELNIMQGTNFFNIGLSFHF